MSIVTATLFFSHSHSTQPERRANQSNSFSSSHIIRVKMDRAASGWKPMLAEVPQGSTLSPMLYNLYTSDLAKSVQT